jgi:hypothetical protein
MFDKGATSSSAPLEASVSAAAEILLQLSRADLSAPSPALVAGLMWPSVVKGKRSRRDSSIKDRRMRLSPSSPFDLSGGSVASTSGSSSPEDLRLYKSGAGRISGLTSASSSKVLDFKCFFLKPFFSFSFFRIWNVWGEILNGAFLATNFMALEHPDLC